MEIQQEGPISHHNGGISNDEIRLDVAPVSKIPHDIRGIATALHDTGLLFMHLLCASTITTSSASTTSIVLVIVLGTIKESKFCGCCD